MNRYAINYNHRGKPYTATIYADSFEDAEVRKMRLWAGEIEQIVAEVPLSPRKGIGWLLKKAGWGGFMFLAGCIYTGLIIGMDVAGAVAL